MDPQDIATRLQDLMVKFATSPDGLGSEGCSAELTSIANEIDTLENGEELRGMVQSLIDMIAMLNDPEAAATYANAQMESYVPDPPIFEAIDAQDLARLSELLQTTDVNARYGNYDQTALYHAIASFDGIHADVVTLLLDAGADPKQGLTHTNVLHGLGFSNPRDMTADQLAPIVWRCVALGADIEQRSDHLQWTPLLTAASEWNEVAVEALLMAGADISARAGDVDGVCFAGQDAFAMAAGHPATLAVLNRYAQPA